MLLGFVPVLQFNISAIAYCDNFYVIDLREGAIVKLIYRKIAGQTMPISGKFFW